MGEQIDVSSSYPQPSLAARNKILRMLLLRAGTRWAHASAFVAPNTTLFFFFCVWHYSYNVVAPLKSVKREQNSMRPIPPKGWKPCVPQTHHTARQRSSSAVVFFFPTHRLIRLGSTRSSARGRQLIEDITSLCLTLSSPSPPLDVVLVSHHHQSRADKARALDPMLSPARERREAIRRV